MREIAGGFEAFESAHDEGRNDGTHTDVYKHTQGSTLLLTRVMPKLEAARHQEFVVGPATAVIYRRGFCAAFRSCSHLQGVQSYHGEQINKAHKDIR